MERETGTTATVPCPTCGKQLQLEAAADNSVSPERCTACYPTTETAAKKLPLPTVQRELGTPEASQ